jgi:hypothetical protein
VSEAPNQLDGADVICWAVSSNGGFYTLVGSDPPVIVVAMSVARYVSGEVYLFKCDRTWEVVQDWDCESVEDARERAATHTSERLVWLARD